MVWLHDDRLVFAHDPYQEVVYDAIEEVQLFASTGRPLGALSGPRTLQGDVQPPPVYDSAGLSVQDGEIVAAMNGVRAGRLPRQRPLRSAHRPLAFDGQQFERASS